MKNRMKIAIWSLVRAIIIFGSFAGGRASGLSPGLLATKESRRVVVSTEAGGITAVDVSDGWSDVGSYHLEFFTLDTRSLFLPVLLHTDMVFFVHTGRGTISWIGKKNSKVMDVDLEPGDIYRLEEGTVFYIKSSSDTNREKLRIHAIFKTFANEPNVGTAYSNVTDLIRGFDARILQMSFGVTEEVIEEMKKAEKPPPIIHFERSEGERYKADWREGVFEALLGRNTHLILNEKKKETFNIMKSKPDVENKHGRSISVTHKDAKLLKGSSMGMFMVNLTRRSMVGPHWNPNAAEIGIVVRGHGMVQVVSSTLGLGDEKCRTMSFYVKEGDVFVVPRFDPMVQMSFENESFVFVGFSTNVKRDHPQFLAGKWSVLRTMKREILAAAFNVKDAALEQLLAGQEEAVLMGCEGCAEQVQKKLEAEIERKKREEEERRQVEEEAARRQEEEERRREEEEAKKREEEKRREEEEEEERRRQEEEEEARRRKEEEEAKKREEEKRREKEEEEERRRHEEEEEAIRRQEKERRREEEEAKEREEEKRREEEEERERRREEEEEEAKKREEEEEEAQRREEKERREEEEAKKKEEEKRREKEEEEAQRKEVEEEEEEAQRREEKERREEEAKKKEEEKRREKEEEEAQRREEEEEEAKKRGEEEEEAQRREEKERREEEEAKKRDEEHWRKEEEKAKKREEDQRREEDEEEAQRREQERREEEEEEKGEEEKRRKEEEERQKDAKVIKEKKEALRAQ